MNAADSAAAIGEILGVPVERRESDYFGIYWRATLDGGEVRIISQPDPDGESVEDDFPEFPTLIYVESSSFAGDLESQTIAGQAIHKLREDV